jgi:Uncharacterised protein family (UPF0160)
MISPTLLLTHPGSAHKDEFLACCFLLAFYPVPIERREPTAADLATPDICVIDVGHCHEPELNNFDHHQLPREQVPTCSLSLVLQHRGLYKDAREFCDWLETAEWFDCRGPIDTAKWLGIDRGTLSKVISPVDITLLRRFSSASRLTPSQPIWEVMRMVGEDIVGHVTSSRAKLEQLQRVALRWELEIGGAPGLVVFLPRTDTYADDIASSLDRFIDRQPWAPQVVASVYPDRRAGGYGLSRYRDNPRLDFTRITREADVHFAHARGFVAKTSANQIPRLQALVIAAGRI